MSSSVARLLELHLTHGADIIIIVHGQMSVGNHLWSILWLVRRFRLWFLLHFTLGSRSLAFLGSLLCLGLQRTASHKLATDWRSCHVSLRIWYKWRVTGKCWMRSRRRLLLICRVLLIGLLMMIHMRVGQGDGVGGVVGGLGVLQCCCHWCCSYWVLNGWQTAGHSRSMEGVHIELSDTDRR